MARSAAHETLRPYVFLHPLGERASAGWLTDGAEAVALDVALVDESPERSARLLASSLREGGLGYAVVGARGRGRLEAELARVGLTAGPTFLARPAPWAAERLLAPDTAVLAEALGRRPGIARALRRLPFRAASPPSARRW
jgi:hypothetical protein